MKLSMDEVSRRALLEVLKVDTRLEAIDEDAEVD